MVALHPIATNITPRHPSKVPASCPYCSATNLTKRGRRKNKHETIQLWLCTSCNRVFTPALAKGKSYPVRIIIDALAWYAQGYSITETLRRIRRKHGVSPSESAARDWLEEYRDLCTYNRVRVHLRKRFRPANTITAVKLCHQQVYKYSTHRAKLDWLTKEGSEHERFAPLRTYLERMLRGCPHNLFLENAPGSRASKSGIGFDISDVQITEKQNNATEMARFVLSSVGNNRLRHESLQRFMLLCDSTTVAVEVPIFLTPNDFRALAASGLSVPVIDRAITGHVDFIQIRNGVIHILDYKPDARTNRPVEQLTLYALALSRATGLRLYDFKCAWFNEDTYCEFFPLHVVHKKRVAVHIVV